MFKFIIVHYYFETSGPILLNELSFHLFYRQAFSINIGCKKFQKIQNGRCGTSKIACFTSNLKLIFANNFFLTFLFILLSGLLYFKNYLLTLKNLGNNHEK